MQSGLSDLYKQNIETISCGSFALYRTVPVNISILQPSFLSGSPQVYTAVIVCYRFELVFSVDVSWRKFQVSMVRLRHKYLNAHCMHGYYSNQIVLNTKIHKNTSSMSLDVGGCGSTITPVKIIFARQFSVIVQRI